MFTSRESSTTNQSMKLDEIIKAHVVRVFMAQNQNMERTAKVLGIGRATMYRYFKRYKLGMIDGVKERDGIGGSHKN